MYNYTIYCSEEQTKKALELGAPIINYPIQMAPYGVPKYERQLPSGKRIAYVVPTAEQMINWLAEQEILLCINPTNSSSNFYWIRGVKVGEKYKWESHFEINKCKTSFNTRQEATFDAIDKALDYLLKK